MFRQLDRSNSSRGRILNGLGLAAGMAMLALAALPASPMDSTASAQSRSGIASDSDAGLGIGLSSESSRADGLMQQEPTSTVTPTVVVSDTATPEPTVVPETPTDVPPTEPPTITPTPTPLPAYLPLLTLNASKDDLPEAQRLYFSRDEAMPFMLPTLDGNIGIPGALGEGADQSWVFIGRHPYSIFSQQVWDADADMLFDTSPDDVNYVFMSYAETEEEVRAQVEAQRDRLEAALASRPENEQRLWKARLFYVSVNPMTLDSWFPDMLEQWGTSNPLARFTYVDEGEETTDTLDTVADSGWAPRISEANPLAGELAWLGRACNGDAAEQDVSGKVALVERGTCAFTEKVLNAERFGATGVVMFTDDRPKIEMGGTCEPCPNISVVMIDREPGLGYQARVEAGETVTVEVDNFWAQAPFAAIDHAGLLREFGSIPYAFPQYSRFDLFEQVAYEAQYFSFEFQRDSRLRAEEEAGEVLVIPVYEDVLVSDPGWTGRRAVAEFNLPDAETLAQYDTLEVDMDLGCVDGQDENCGAWDYIVHLYACDDSTNPDRCNTELLRWITAYGRQTHWVTDASSLLAHFSAGGTQRVGLASIQPYVINMSIRLSKKAGDSLAARDVVPLFGGGRFVEGYNDQPNKAPVTFEVPADVERVELVTYITGHGFAGDTQGCAEFCNHTHEYVVNGRQEAKIEIRNDHVDPQDPVNVPPHDPTSPEPDKIRDPMTFGCSNAVLQGVAPNQYGTWPFGRAGWCPGLDVPPMRFDITDQVEIGASNVITYFGGYRGETYVPQLAPDSTSFDARIDQVSYLVYYTRPILNRDPAPAMQLPVEGGSLEIGPEGGDESHVFIGHHPNSLLSQQIWDSSLENLFQRSPDDVNYVFMSYADTSEAVSNTLGALEARVDAVLAGFSPEEEAHWRDHLHFVSENPMNAGGDTAALLQQWGTANPLFQASWEADGETRELSLDTAPDSGWAKPLSLTEPLTAELAWYGLACNEADGSAPEPAQDLEGKIALIERGVCAFTEKTENALEHGAVGVVIFTDEGRAKGSMGCAPCPNIPISAVMIDRAPGLEMRDQLLAGATIEATLANFWAQATAFAVDHQGKLRKFGRIPFGFVDFDLLQHLAYEAQYLSYEHGRDTALAEGDARVIPVFEQEVAGDPGWSGKRSAADVVLPTAEEMKDFDKLEIDLGLACNWHDDTKCPPWDYEINLYLCDEDDPSKCGTEITRWITPYGREGRWVTDITPILSHISEGGTRRFSFYTQQRYITDMSLRFIDTGEAEAPSEYVELFGGGTFNLDYNAKYEPVAFTVPEDVTRVELVGMITGHGWGLDQANCAEFCNHTHHFEVNGEAELVKENVDAGTDFGCANRVLEGVVPNQYGTWIYGRAGWCPGEDVEPWRVDITEHLTKGAENVITYRGLFEGEDYDPQLVPEPPANAFAANIHMRSFLVFYREGP